jgi:hypothetical protein
MRVVKNVFLARTAGLLAVVTLPAIIWLGWWQLAVSAGLAIVAAAATPNPELGEHEGWLRRQLRVLQLRRNPHSWRPGRR